MTYHIRRVLEYSEFFQGEAPIDIVATLKLFNRNELVRMAAILSLHYGNMYIPNNERTIFSESSKKHISNINNLFQSYYKRTGISPNEKVQILTFRTGLELWRQIFAIHTDEFKDDIEECDIEFTLFKVIPALNEKITSYNRRTETYRLDELMFLNGFLTNDTNNYSLKTVLQPQIYYFRILVDYIPSNEVLSSATSILFRNWGINNWQQYYATIIWLAYETDKYYNNKQNGLPIISLKKMELNDKTGLFSSSLVEKLSINEDEYIPFLDEESQSSAEWNIDYRRFSSKPFVKLKNGAGYLIINNQLLCERLFNSLYFDFIPLINGKEGSCGFFNYNKDFVEKILFRQTFFNCLPTNSFSFPIRNSQETSERPNEPDFYARTKRAELIIVECKAIKMNGECRDDGDYIRLLDELQEKIVLKTRNLDKRRKRTGGQPKPIGVGQLINHIDSIEADSFEWDKNIPDEVSYYPILVFEDVRFLQPGLLSILNRWFYEKIEEMPEIKLSEMACKPIMPISINTLYLYDNFIRKKGLPNIINTFLDKNAIFDESTGKYQIKELADFDGYLRQNPFNKSNEVAKWLNKAIKKRYNVNTIMGLMPLQP